MTNRKKILDIISNVFDIGLTVVALLHTLNGDKEEDEETEEDDTEE